MLMVHPSLFSIGNLTDDAGLFAPPQEEQRHHQANSPLSTLAFSRFVKLPPTLHPTISSLADDGIYLLDSCSTIYLYIGRNIEPPVVQQIEAYVAADPNRQSSDEININLLARLGRLIWQLRTYAHVGGGCESMLRPNFAPVEIVKDDGGLDGEWSKDVTRWMVCDATSHEKDYVDFLCDIHRRIRSRVDTAHR